MAPTAIPVLRNPGQMQVFMDLYFANSTGLHYVVEMQTKRHVFFNEPALFYACATYASQLSRANLSNRDWHTNLKPVVALQVLNYDTNSTSGISSSSVEDSLPGRTRVNPLPEGGFTKDFVLKGRVSGQQLHSVRLVQVELVRARRNRSLFPPDSSFTMRDWWLSVLNHS